MAASIDTRAVRLNRNVAIAATVVAFHLAAIWALQAGLLQRVVEVVVPVEMLGDLVSPPAPRVETPPSPKAAELPAKEPARSVTRPQAPLAAVPDQRPDANAPVGELAPQPAPTPVAAVAPVAAPAPTAAPAKVELPSTDADYLQNPKPPYPPLSKRLGEQGRVVVRVLIGADGVAQKAEIRLSSGFERLDQSALATAQKWRYVPGKRGGVSEAMWFNVPISFVLE